MKFDTIVFCMPLVLTALLGCNLDKEIDIQIPDFENVYVVESYVSPGNNFGLLITKSYGFFEVFDSNQLNLGQLVNTLVQDVEGYIAVNGVRHQLLNQIKMVPGTNTVYNYLLKDEVQFKEKDLIQLSLTFPTGEKVHATAMIPERRPVDSVRLEINDEMLAREVSILSTDSLHTEYFRRQLIRIWGGRVKVIQDFVRDNKTAKSGKMVFNSGYAFVVGDTLISRVTHLEKSYFDFYNSVSGSINANSNPLMPPGTIASNIKGSDKVIGIFTAINQSQILQKVEK